MSIEVHSPCRRTLKPIGKERESGGGSLSYLCALQQSNCGLNACFINILIFGTFFPEAIRAKHRAAPRTSELLSHGLFSFIGWARLVSCPRYRPAPLPTKIPAALAHLSAYTQHQHHAASTSSSSDDALAQASSHNNRTSSTHIGDKPSSTTISFRIGFVIKGSE